MLDSYTSKSAYHKINFIILYYYIIKGQQNVFHFSANKYKLVYNKAAILSINILSLFVKLLQIPQVNIFFFSEFFVPNKLHAVLCLFMIRFMTLTCIQIWRAHHAFF